MAQKTQQHTFGGSIPENYDRYLGPLLMEPYAKDLARRLPATGLRDVLELACGTGILTRHLRERLAPETKLVATDVSEAMLKIAKSKPGFSKPVEWKAVDATSLPFKDSSFDVVVSQFGIMFFPDKEKALKEIFRVLRPGGKFIFNVWDKLEFNDFPQVAQETIKPIFDGNPPEFYGIPFGYHDHYVLRTEMRKAGFVDVALATIEIKVQAAARDAAMGFVQGNPIADEIEKLGKSLAEVTDQVEQAMASGLGKKICKGRTRAIVIGGRKPGQLSKSAAPKAEPAKEAPRPKTKAAASKPPTTRVRKATAKPKPKPGVKRKA
ncbi:MAG: hypothetical protein QOJ65_1162 [Fimbriimonadaceae bacterium]|jgi:ubiquinone/menaquinone biosynthesis C-methylase UbiE|nr:hypothetical protein [Fimbriimonadaceae bacterium]